MFLSLLVDMNINGQAWINLHKDLYISNQLCHFSHKTMGDSCINIFVQLYLMDAEKPTVRLRNAPYSPTCLTSRIGLVSMVQVFTTTPTPTYLSSSEMRRVPAECFISTGGTVTGNLLGNLDLLC